MAQEIKNTFLKSKMNKDLDDRILPNGEYRDALNISVGRSEDNDVGALENIIGNDLVTGTDIGNGLTIIGVLTNNSTDNTFVFLTDYTDPNPESPTNAPILSSHYIYSYNSNLNTYTRLVQGEFLNFSTTNRIIGINLIENLLFWTDNRNQPRKININLARAFDPGGLATLSGDYYTEEHQISVAKYSPYQSMELYNRVDLQAKTGTTNTELIIEGDRVAELSKFIGAAVVCLESSPPTQGIDFVKVTGVFLTLVGNDTRITVSPAMQSTPPVGAYVSFISSTMSNQNNDDQWPGDPDYLEDKFVRFSYRFKYDDNEYSLMAPFTQIAYIPKQKGYFINGDENAAYQSTVLGFMENLVQNIGLVITLPSKANQLINKYKINEIEILFRESDGIAVKVLESIKASKVSAESGSSNTYTYEYQSRKPYRTLPEAQTVRVYDKVPVRAFAQETSGNRIIYGNFADKHTPPSTINYNCRIAKKSSTGAYNNFIEYPNHSVKRNRNYQIGFVLADKFGRQSPVILSSVDLGGQSAGQFFSGSTIYSPYDILDTDTDVETWFGDSIQVLVNEPISSTRDFQSGAPGLYAEKTQRDSSGEGFAIAPNLQSPAFITNTTYTFQLNDDPTTGFPNNINVPAVGDYMRGAYQDFVKVTNSYNPALSTWIITTDGRVSDVYLRTDGLPSTTPDLKFAYTINDVGWYSYKLVVKQTEQDYYNVYLPGILNGYPGQARAGTDEGGEFPDDETNLTAHTVLFNDNINKVPRDLSEVGDQDKQYRSSVELYGRVGNIMIDGTLAKPSNIQYYPRLDYSGKNAITHTAIAIAAAKDFDMGFTQLSGDGSGPGNPTALDGNKVFYQIDTNPLIARISTTEKSIGWGAELDSNPKNEVWNMLPYLAIYETEPVESLLDIYWETTSSGLIVDLNAEVATQNDGIFAFEGLTWEFREDVSNGDSVTPSYFTPINNQGEPFTTPVSGELLSVTNVNGDPITFFELEQGTGSNLGKFLIKYIGNGVVFEEGSGVNDIYSFVLRMQSDGDIITDIPLTGEVGGFGALENVAPEFDAFNDITKTINDATLIEGGNVPVGWAGSTNGSELPGAQLSELVYSFYATNPQNPLPTNWQMTPYDGELTQLTPESSGGTFLGNPLGEYEVTLRLTDANAETPENTIVPAYTSLFYEQDIIIRLQAAGLNPEVTNTSCVLTPTIADASSFSPISMALNSTPYLSVSAARIYYIAENNYPSSNYFTNNGVLPELPPVDQISNFRIGTGAHTSGELVITTNIYKSGATQVGFSIPSFNFYYRFVGDTNWIEMPRSYEENAVGKDSLSGENTANRKITVPRRDNPNDGETAEASNRLGIDVYFQAVRAFNYDDFPENNGIEYAITCSGLRQEGEPLNGVDDVRAWVQVDDLRNPACVPWLGVNAVTANGGAGNLFKYFRSSGNGDSAEYVDLSSGTTAVYSETPYGEHVNTFYTGASNFVPYIPSAGNNYINYKIDRNLAVETLPQWTNLYPQNQPTTWREYIDLQWITGFDFTTGLKIRNPGLTTGISARQTGQDVDGTVRNYGNGGTARWKLNVGTP